MPATIITVSNDYLGMKKSLGYTVISLISSPVLVLWEKKLHQREALADAIQSIGQFSEIRF
jgi:hypothetical protein